MQTKMRGGFMLAMALLLLLGGAGCTAKAKKAYHQSRANRFYDAGQYDRAEIEYMNVLRSDPVNVQAFGRLGLIYYEQGRLQRAAFFLAKGSQMAPNDLNLRMKLGFIYSSAGQFQRSLEQANFILDRKPLDDEAPLLLAETAIQPKEIAAARLRLETMARTSDRVSVEVALGNLAMREQNLAAAGAAFKKAQALDAKSATVNASLAALAWAQGDLKQAEALFKAAADASRVRSPRRMQYVRFKIQTGDASGARQVLEEIRKQAADYVPAVLVLAEIAATEKKYDECAGLLNQVQALDPDNFDGLLFQGRLDLSRGEPAKAVTDMERMARVYPLEAVAHYQLGNAYFAANDPVKAVGSLNRALEINTNYFEATLLKAQIQIAGGNPGAALVSLEGLLQKQPQLAPAQLLLADAYRLQARTSDRLQGRLNDALAIYDSLEKRFPKNEQIPLLRGETLLQLPDAVAARKAFERALELSADHLPAVEKLVDLDLAQTNYASAMQRVSAEVQKNPKRMEFQMLTAKVFLAQDKRDQAEATLLKAIEIDPAAPGAYLLLAEIYLRANQIEKALAKVDAVMAKDPKNVVALMMAANIYTAGNNAKAEADAYEKILKIEPDNGVAACNLAYLYSETLNHPDRAYELAQRARKLLPLEPAPADTLGWICFKKGLYPTALGLLQESAAKLSEPEVQFHLGMAYYMTADEEAARTALQRAFQSGTAYPGSNECLRCLSILKIQPATADAAARAVLDKRISEKPDDPVALVRIARIHQREGNSDKATAAYEAILKVVPNNLDAMLNLTRLYEAVDKGTSRAYEMAQAANKLAPYNPEVTHNLGRLAFLSGEYQLAAGLLQQTLQTQPNDAQLLYDYAQAAYSIGKIPEAKTALQNSLAANLAAAPAAQARQMLELIGLADAPAQAAAASSRIGEIVKAAPDNVPALMAQAAASEAKADSATVALAYEKILGRYPDFAPAQKQLARLYAGTAGNAKADQAYGLAAKALKAFPNDPALGKIMGVILVQRRDYSHAVNLLKQSAAALNSDAELFYYLGTAQFQLNNRTESKANLQQALALKLAGPPAESAKKMLSEIK